MSGESERAKKKYRSHGNYLSTTTEAPVCGYEQFDRSAPAQVRELVDLLCGSRWHFHVNSEPTPTQVHTWLEEGHFDGAEARSFLIRGQEGWEEGRLLGLVRLTDLDGLENETAAGATTPLVDLRVREALRGRGIGRAALTWLTGYAFTTFPGLRRIEGTTRHDNEAMRRTFRSCGYVKEAHYREAWPAPDEGGWYDSVGYAVLRRDWKRGG